MKKENGFTLVELLIVVGIIGVLMGLLAPAILKASKTAVDKGHIVEMETLETALTEYHHDNKGWPIPAKPKSEGAQYGINSIGKADPAIIVYSGKNTSKVWNRLIVKGAKSGFNSRKRDYIDVTSLTAIKNFYENDPQKNIEDGNIGSPKELWGDNGEIKGPLVYWSTFIECTKCGEWSTSSTQCNNEKCSGRDKNGNPYKFKKADKKNTRRGVMPYKIKFDLTSNLVFVTE
ncbi:MAG: type II secretion system protein [Kiritimatiellae bacterium]|nr:type II secretion system protein [Kiritimatiellia bacterium]